MSPAVAATGSEGGLSPEEVQAIRSTSERYVEAMRANDWAKVAGFFAADAIRGWVAHGVRDLEL